MKTPVHQLILVLVLTLALLAVPLGCSGGQTAGSGTVIEQDAFDDGESTEHGHAPDTPEDHDH